MPRGWCQLILEPYPGEKAMTHAAGFLSEPLLHLQASPSHFHPSLAGKGVKYPVYRSPAPQGLQCLSWAGASLPHTTHPTGMGYCQAMGLIWPQPSCCFLSTLGILGILETLCILGIQGTLSALDTLGILDTLSLRTCFQKLVFWEILKPRVFLGHLLRETPLAQPSACRCPTAVSWGENWFPQLVLCAQKQQVWWQTHTTHLAKCALLSWELLVTGVSHGDFSFHAHSLPQGEGSRKFQQ